MSVVIVGGHDRMASRYKEICKAHQCKAKVFTQMPPNLEGKIGTPDLLILFTSTVSHKMVSSALRAVENSGTGVIRSHTSSASALQEILKAHC